MLDMGSVEFHDLFDTMTEFSMDAFLKTCLEPLKEIAASQDVRKKRRLRFLLGYASARSPERILLLQILNQRH